MCVYCRQSSIRGQVSGLFLFTNLECFGLVLSSGQSWFLLLRVAEFLSLELKEIKFVEENLNCLDLVPITDSCFINVS